MSQALRAERHGWILCKGVEGRSKLTPQRKKPFVAEENYFYVIPAFSARDMVVEKLQTLLFTSG